MAKLTFLGGAVYLDSPMAIDASEIFCSHAGEHRLSPEQCRTACRAAEYVRSVEDSKALDRDQFPKVIVSASGMAAEVIEDGRAWRKFQAICEAQGGMRRPPVAGHQKPVTAPSAGSVSFTDNRRLAMVAKLAGAPDDKAAGLSLHVRLGSVVEKGQPLFTVHAETPGELAYALDYLDSNPDIIGVGQP